jgi:spore maturation protein CgeB
MNERLRVLVVLPLYGGSLTVGRYAVRALEELGHSARVFEAPDFYTAYEAFKGLQIGSDRLEYLENSFLSVVSQAVAAQAEAFRPDLVLAMAQAPLNRQVLARFRREGVPTAMWFVEDYRLFTYWRAFAPMYDFFAVIQGEDFLDELYRMGCDNVLYLPLAADPSFHRPLELSGVERRKFGSDVSFMGAGYPNRRRAFKRLTGYDFKIWGTEWEGEPALEPHLQMSGARVSAEDCVKIFNASKVNLNLHSSIDPNRPVAHGDFINPRTFELAACGAFQLVDERTLLEDLFEPEEIAVFSDMDELEEKIDYFLTRPEEREAYARRARERIMAEHTYAHRMQSLIDFVSLRLPDWPRRDTGPERDFPDMPPELGQKVYSLLEELGLPSDIGFEDLVTAIRGRRGRLTDVETAILFLDEWRKQYG